MMTTVLIEDEVYIRKGLISLIESLDHDIEIVGQCGTIKEGVAMLNQLNPALVFLDIQLKDGTGFEILKKTKELQYKIIFITAYEEYALQAIKNGAVDYILKPVDVDELDAAIHKAIKSDALMIHEQVNVIQENIQGNSNRIVLRMQNNFQVIHLEDLIFCKSDGNYTTFYLSDKREFTTSKSIKEYEKQLPKEFVRSHQSYIVNLNFVDQFDKSGYAILKNQKKIPVSTRKKEEFLSKLLS